MTQTLIPTVPADVLAWADRFVPGTPPELCRTLAAVARYADPDGRNSHPLFPVLVAYAGVSESKARRDLAELVRRGLVEVSEVAPASLLALPRGNRPAVYHVPALVGRSWERPGSLLDAGECEVVAAKFAANASINPRGVTRSTKGVTAGQEIGRDRFEIAETLLNEINTPEIFAPTAYRLARNLLCAALKNGHTPDWLRTLLAEPCHDGSSASTQILIRLHSHQHPPARAERIRTTEPAEPGKGNRAFVEAFEMAHQIASAEQTPRRQYIGYEFTELLHLLLTAALNGATRTDLERIVHEVPPAGRERVDQVLRSLWALARGESRPPVARPPVEPEPEPEVWATRTPDRELDQVLAEQADPIPPDTATTWADRIIRRINLHHTLLHQLQVVEMRWPLVKALRNGQPPAHLARVMIQPTTNTEDPGAELLHRITLHYWPGRTP